MLHVRSLSTPATWPYSNLDHLDAAIALFDPEQTPRAVTRYVTKHRAQKGHVRRFVLEYLRDAREPVRSEQITTAWLEARSLRTDTQTYVVIRKRIGACLTKLRTDGVAEAPVMIGEYKGWILVI
jgi:hypothetical protein